jgi:DNA-binding NarL/FixJ family response regulator
MPRLNGLEAAKEILPHCPNAIIVSDSLHDMNLFVKQLKEIGVKGFVAKLWLGLDLLSTVEAVLKGQTCFPSVAPEELNAILRADDDHSVPRLHDKSHLTP